MYLNSQWVGILVKTKNIMYQGIKPFNIGSVWNWAHQLSNFTSMPLAVRSLLNHAWMAVLKKLLHCTCVKNHRLQANRTCHRLQHTRSPTYECTINVCLKQNQPVGLVYISTSETLVSFFHFVKFSYLFKPNVAIIQSPLGLYTFTDHSETRWLWVWSSSGDPEKT